MLLASSMKWIPLFHRSRSAPASSELSLWPVMPKGELLQPDHRQAGITGIYQASHTNERYFSRLYRPALDSFARLVQQLPASEVDHHAAPGGLLDHALESALNALRIRRAHMLPADAAPEDVSRHEPLWTYAVFAAALVHDVGKVVVDQRITLFDRRKSPLPEPWSPFAGFMDERAHWYAVEFRRDRRYGLHQRTAAMLAPQILPAAGLAWLASNTEVFAAFSASVTGQMDEAGILGQIVTEADRLSVARNKGAAHGTYMAARTKPLHEKLLTALRVLLDQGELALNRPGAAGWLTGEGLWMMGTRTVSTLRQHLTEEGHSGIPSSNSRLFDELMQHGVVISNDGDKAIWRIRVTQGDWKPDPFTVLRFRPEKIWPLIERRAAVFDGEVEIVASEPQEDEGRAGGEGDGAATKPETKHSTGKPDDDLHGREDGPPVDSKADSDTIRGPWLNTAASDTSEPASNAFAQPRDASTHAGNDATTNQDGNDAKASLGRIFYDWVTDGLRNGSIRYNHVDAAVHVVEEGVLLVSPKIFRRFLQDHPECESWNKVQKHAQRLHLNEKTPEKTNIHTYQVKGDNRAASQLKGFLIPDKVMLFGEKIPDSNPYLTAATQPE